MSGIPPRASDRSGRLVTRIGCIRAREAHKARTLHSITRRGPDSERIRAFLFLPNRLAAGSPSRPTGMHRLRVGAGGSLFNKLPRTRLHNWVRCVLATQADIAQQGERGHAMAEAPGSMPGIRSKTSHCGCVPAQRPGMRPSTCGDGRNVRRRDACARAARAHHSGAPRSRWSTTAMRSKPMVLSRKSSRLVSGPVARSL